MGGPTGFLDERYLLHPVYEDRTAGYDFDTNQRVVNVGDGLLQLNSVAITGTAAEINRATDLSARIVTETLTTLSVTLALHDSRTITMDYASGTTYTLPAATGTGARFKFVVITLVTTNNHIIEVANTDDTMTGKAFLASDGATSETMFPTASTSDTITMNGSTTGGLKGDIVYVEDVASNLWHVMVYSSTTGGESTPFSAAVA